MLAFCGERSLLQSYSAAAFTLATFSTEAKHRQEIDSLLDALRPHLAAAQYANVYDQCWVLRTQH
jgi:hypothetical protein